MMHSQLPEVYVSTRTLEQIMGFAPDVRLLE